MHPTRLIAILSSVAFFVSSCDWVYGVSHWRRDIPVPDRKCIESALLAVPGVSGFEYRQEKGGRPLTAHGIEKPDDIQRYWYKYSGLHVNFYFIINYKGEVEFHHTYIDINQLPPQSEIDRIRPAMFAIEKQIDRQCIAGFASEIVEHCSEVKCE